MDTKPLKWSSLEHEIYRELKKLSVSQARLLVAVSGGADSMALLEILRVLASPLKLHLEVCHLHHGKKPQTQLAFRNKAFYQVQKYCAQHKINFHTNLKIIKGSKKVFTSLPTQHDEAGYRKFRYDFLRNIKLQTTSQLIATAHHLNDLLETRLIRLIRGVGPEGIESMKMRESDLLRPLLKIERHQIIEYLKSKNIRWVEDPSNKKLDSLRNWVRHSWLKSLEKKRPGASNALARSLDNLSQLGLSSNRWTNAFFTEQGIKKDPFLSLDHDQKKQVLASYLKILGSAEYTASQIEEVLKHLDSSQKVHTFQIRKCRWQVSSTIISVTPIS